MQPSRPFLFLDQSELDRVRHRIRDCDWARLTWTDIRKEAERFRTPPIQCPPYTGQGNSLTYQCPGFRHLLEPDLQREGIHLCRICNKEFRGPSYDAGYTNYRHHQLAQSAQDLALVGVAEQDARFLQKAKDILLAYAAAFPTYPRQPGTAIVSCGRSEETMTLLPLVFAYDLLAGASVFSSAEAETIERDLLRPGMEDLLLGTGEAGTALSNHAQWALAGAAILALCLRDDDAFQRAGHNPSGFSAAFSHGLLDDFHWWEGSMAYHIHMLWGLILIAEASRHTAHSLYRSQYRDKLREMFLAPLRLAGPDDAFPAVNDSNRMKPSGWTIPALYELALARFGDPEFAHVLQETYREDPQRRANSNLKIGWGYPRTGFLPVALLYGVDEIPAGRSAQRHSRVLADQGFVRLGGDPGFEQPYLVLTYGEQDAGHKHADRLGFLYEYDGVPLLADSGYGFASWKNTAIAHNTVVTDETSHGPTRGRLRGFLNLPWAKVLRATAGETCLAQGVTLERVQALLPDCLIDLFHVRSDRAHTFDYLLHSPAEWQPDVATKASKGPAFGSANYLPLESRRMGKALVPWSAKLGSAEAVFPMGAPTEFIVARTKADLNLLALRRKGKRAVFVSVILPLAGSHVVRRISPKDQNRWIAIELRCKDGTRTIFSWDSEPTLPPRTLADTKIRSRVAVLALDQEGCVRETALLGSPDDLRLQLVPEAAALLPGESRRFDLCCYGDSPAHKKIRIRASDGLKVSAIKWEQEKQVWCGRFNVAAPKTTQPGLETITVRAKERCSAPIAILPPPVKAVLCPKAGVARGEVKIGHDPHWESVPAFYVPVVMNQVQRAFTQVQTFFDDAAIHFRLTCGEPRMKHLVVDGQADNPLALFNDDHIEILLDTDGDPATYFQLGVNAANLGCANFTGMSGVDFDWKHSVRRLKNRWEAYVTIPFPKSLAAPKAGDCWKVNIVRLRRAAGREDSAMVMGPGGFHCPQLFLPLICISHSPRRMRNAPENNNKHTGVRKI